ncbi:sterol desaturase family protein [Halobacteriovorax marinus]|uniref:sterol desaturase family protein n=1 Tax=Halobacteriovorax marinus TaxID=97084 RepID=UPI000BDF2FDE|nr:sterol desaturase family protein [Halobacteriovorax marinus]
MIAINIKEWATSSFFLFSSPSNRLYYLYLISFIILALLFAKNKKEIFTKSYWFNPSAIFDYKVYGFNSLLKVLLITPVIFSVFTVTKSVLGILYFFFPNFSAFSLSDGSLLWFFTFYSFIINDFFRFFLHFLMHKIPFLWKFHRTHHTATMLTPFTLHRNHPVEVLLAQCRNVISLGVISGSFMFLFNKQVGGIDILGVNFIGFLFNLLGSNLRHSHIFLGYGPMEYLFLSPAQHQIHHAKDVELYNKNYGIVLSVWDILFKSFRISRDVKISGFGTGEKSVEHTFKSQILSAFKP